MVTLKLFLGLILGIGLYGFMSYYQPITESYAATDQAEAQALESNANYDFISPIPYELVITSR